MFVSIAERAVRRFLPMILVGLSCYMPACTVKETSQPEKLTIAEGRQQNVALVYIAKAEGLFAEEGLDVTLLPRFSGKECLQEVLKGNAHLATVAETPLVFSALRGERLYTISTISEPSRSMAVVARKDRGISAPADLKGKTIGVTHGTNGDYFLHVFMTLTGLSEKEVRIVDLRPEEMADAIFERRIDAAATWEPHVGRLRTILGAVAETFYGEQAYTMTFNLTGTREYVAGNPETIRRVVRAIVKSESFLKDNPEKASRIIAAGTGEPAAVVLENLGNYRHEAVLKHSLVTAMESQARWAIRKGLVPGAKMPNFMDSIYMDGLLGVKREAVTVIR